MIESFEVALGEGIHALDYNLRRARADGYAVVDGCEPTAGTGLDVNVSGGTIYHNGTSVGVGSQTVTLASGETEPRKDTVFIDSTGAVNVEQGTATARLPEAGGRFETYAPAPPLPSGGPHVVVGEVFVPAGASSVGSADVRDRRVSSEAEVYDITVDRLDITPLKSGSFVASGGGRPAADHTVVGVETDETQGVEVLLRPASSPTWAGDYDYNYEVARNYDASDGEVDVNIVVEWETDPGSGNDLTLDYDILPRY